MEIKYISANKDAWQPRSLCVYHNLESQWEDLRQELRALGWRAPHSGRAAICVADLRVGTLLARLLAGVLRAAAYADHAAVAIRGGRLQARIERDHGPAVEAVLLGRLA